MTQTKATLPQIGSQPSECHATEDHPNNFSKYTISRLVFRHGRDSHFPDSTNNLHDNMVTFRQDGNKPLHYESIGDVISVMREKEAKYYPRWHDLDELNALWRKILLDWMAFVVDHCHLRREAVAAAAYYLDFAMAKGLVETREEHQLAAACALQLSLKLFDSTVIRIEKLVKLGRGVFTKDDVSRMEYQLLTAMNWNVHPPSTYCYLRQFMILLPAALPKSSREMMEQATSVITDVSIVDPTYNQYPQAELAYAICLLAMELLQERDFPILHRQCFVIHMSTVAKLNSSSQAVLSAFESLKDTLDASPKLEDLVVSLALARKKARRNAASKDPSSPASMQVIKTGSPRNVTSQLFAGYSSPIDAQT